MSRLLARGAVVVAVTAAAAALLPGVAFAGGPGVWTNLSQNAPTGGFPRTDIIDEPTVVRVGSSLQVAWRASTGTNASEYRTRIVAANGNPSTGVVTALSGWQGLTGNPSLVVSGGQRLLAFSGLQDTVTSNPLSFGAEHTIRSADGVSWSLDPGSFSNTTRAYGAYGNAAVDDAGVPVWVGNAGTTSGIQWHRGLDPAIPASTADGQFLLSGCCAYNANAARDQATGGVYAAFYSNSNVTTEQGTQVGRILPSSGPWVQAPFSVTPWNGGVSSAGTDQRVAMVARTGGGVWVAYMQGYPNVTKVRLFEAVTGRTVAVPLSAGADNVALAAGPSGRIWVFWRDRGTNTFRVVRSNPAVTAFGAQRVIRPPAGYNQSLWHTTGDAANGPLDLVVSASRNGVNQVDVFHQQVLPTLTVAVGSRPFVNRRTGAVLYPVVVTDAGARVRGATVRIRIGRASTVVGTTTSLGVVYLPKPARAGTYTLTASKVGYYPASTSLRIR